MLIPHFVVLYFLNIAALVVVIIGWWAALFTGWLPQFAVSYLSGFVQWYTRVQAYSMLLTDQYPPFSFGDEPAYPVRVAIPPRDELNRLAVFFRIILAIPAGLLNTIVTYGGVTIVAFIAWLIALVTGKLPKSLHLAYTAILRYSVRYNCYLFMLTATYPRGLFGDGPALPDEAAVPPAEGPAEAAAPAAEAPVDAAVPDPGVPADSAAPAAEAPVDAAGPGLEGSAEAAAPAAEAPADAAVPGAEVPVEFTVPGYGEPAYGVPGYGVPAYGVPAYGAVGYGIPVDPAAWQPVDWRLLLTRGARQLVGWFIGIGAVLFAASITLNVINGFSESNAVIAQNAITRVNAANTALNTELSKYQSTVQACTNAPCVETADGQAATAFTNLASVVHDTAMPGSAAADANSVYSDATKVAQDLTKLSHLSSTITAPEYQSTVNSMGISQATTQFQRDFSALGDALNAAAH